MPLTVAELEDIRSNYFAEDVPIEEEMTSWTEDQAIVFFDSGGTTRPGSAANAKLQGFFALPPAKLISGKDLSWSEVAGKPVFMMNVASR